MASIKTTFPWGLVLALVVGVLGYLVPQTNATDHSHNIDRSWVLSPTSSFAGFPLPHPVDEETHRDLLDERFPGMLDNLVRARSHVCSNLTAGSRKYYQHLAGVTKMFTCSDSEYTEIAFHADIALARERLRLADSQINSLAGLYHGVRESYDTLNATAAEALDQTRLSNKTEFLSYLRYWMDPWLGFDAHAMYYFPWKNSLRKMEEVRSGIVALEREMQRLEHIKLEVQELEHFLRDLAVLLIKLNARKEGRLADETDEDVTGLQGGWALGWRSGGAGGRRWMW